MALWPQLVAGWRGVIPCAQSAIRNGEGGMTVAEVRRQIPTLQNMIYMNTGWSGPSPEPVVAQIRSWIDYEVREGPANRHVYVRQQDKQQEVREAVAKLLHRSE